MRTLPTLMLALIGLTSAIVGQAASDAPLTLERVVIDIERTRSLPLRIYLPRDRNPAPVILFSHGLGGSRDGNAYLGTHWAASGYVVVFLQHPGSDAAVWQGVPPADRRAALKGAADIENFIARVRDVPVVLDALERWNSESGDELAGRMNLQRIGMSGHSFGAITTQAVAGQQFLRGGHNFTDPRIDAALMMSPSAPRRGGRIESAFENVRIPWLLMTGTRDTAVIGDATVDSRLAVFPALPAGRKFELVLDRAEHSAFSDRALPGDREPRNPNHHRAILALSTAFWDAWLKDDVAAQRRLQSEAARSALEAADRWQWK
jgi:predicted dienelactone hydrolase